MSTHPALLRLTVWMLTAFLVLFAYLASNAWFSRLVDYINDLFIIKG